MRVPRLHAITLLAAAMCGGCAPRVHESGLDLPNVVLWAWERPEDLRFLDPVQTGVAFLAATALIERDGSVLFHPRTQRILLPATTPVLAVVRIASPFQHHEVQAQPLLAGLGEIARLPKVRGVQIDFDARASERNFYRTLLERMRVLTPKPISVTALASWCSGDRWLDREPITEAVPMFFRLGKGESHDMSIESSICSTSIGLSTDEPWPAKRPPGIDRIYLFSPHSWTQPDYLAAVNRIRNWK